jgi:hypothetical protein
MVPASTPAPRSLRIVGAIALKDMREAIQNRIILGILLGATMLTLSGVVLPRLLAGRSGNVAVVYDPGATSLLAAWAARGDMRMVGVDSQAELERVVAEATIPMLGLVLPQPLELAPGPGGAMTIDGYVAHWASEGQVAREVSFFEARLSEVTGRTVLIATAGHAVYPLARAGGQVALYAMHLATQLLIIGVAVVPYLLIEEKEAHTFDALLVSPASYAQVVAGKALAGAAYCLLGGAIVLALVTRWIVHWDLALVALLLGAALAVGVGLLGGALARDAQTLGMGMALVVLILLLPAILGLGSLSGLPAWARAALPYFPTTALMDLIRASMAGEVSAASIAQQVAVLAASAAGVFALLIWRVRQAGR